MLVVVRCRFYTLLRSRYSRSERIQYCRVAATGSDLKTVLEFPGTNSSKQTPRDVSHRVHSPVGNNVCASNQDCPILVIMLSLNPSRRR